MPVHPETKTPVMGWFIAVIGVISMVASYLLARDGYLLAAEGQTPSCDINPFFSCGNVMESWQARVFFDAPNQLLGIAGWAVVSTIGVGLIQGARFRRWFWWATTIGLFAAWFFLMWLFVQAAFSIGFLCLYCMVVWVTHTILLWVYLPWALARGLLTDNARAVSFGQATLPFAWVPIVGTFATIVIAVWVQFPLLFSF